MTLSPTLVPVVALLYLGVAAAASGSVVKLQCPVETLNGNSTAPGGWTATSDTNDLQKAAETAWANIAANNASSIPVNAGQCDLNQAILSPIEGCSQVVAGTNRIVQFSVAFPDCHARLFVAANVFEPLPGQGKPVINDFEVVRRTPPATITIPLYGQCGGAGDKCVEVAEEMGLPVKEVCLNKDWPSTVCAEGSGCTIWNKWFRSCMPSDVPLKCPILDISIASNALVGVSATASEMNTGRDPFIGASATATRVAGGYVADTDTAKQAELDAFVWSQLIATNKTGLPAGSDCDAKNAVIQPLDACSQVVEGTNWILSFKVSFPESCALYTTVDANVFEPLPGQGKTTIKDTRIAPYDSAPEYKSCVMIGGKNECQKMLVFQEWHQCGGTGDACVEAASRLGNDPNGGFCSPTSSWPYSECAYGSTCVRAGTSFFQCQPKK